MLQPDAFNGLSLAQVRYADEHRDGLRVVRWIQSAARQQDARLQDVKAFAQAQLPPVEPMLYGRFQALDRAVRLLGLDGAYDEATRVHATVVRNCLSCNTGRRRTDSGDSQDCKAHRNDVNDAFRDDEFERMTSFSFLEFFLELFLILWLSQRSNTSFRKSSNV
jgi:hypothetical protein